MPFLARTATIAAFLLAGCTVPLDGPDSPVTAGTYLLPLGLQDDPSNRFYGNVSIDLVSGDVILTAIPYNELVIHNVLVTITDPATGRFRQAQSFNFVGGRAKIPNLQELLSAHCGNPLELRADVIVSERPYRSVQSGIVRLRIPTRCTGTK